MRRLVVLFVALAVAVAMAGLFLPSTAATVGNTSVSRQSLDSDLSAIAGSPNYTCFLSEERQLASGKSLPFLGAGTASGRGGVYDASFVDDWLGLMITDQATAGVLSDRGLRLTSSDVGVAHGVLVRHMTQALDEYARAVGSPAAGCGGSAQAVLSSLPGWFVSQQVTAEADQDLLDAHAAGSSLAPPAVSNYFVHHRRAFDRDCLDIVVVKSKRAAAKVESALSHGTSFAKEAQVASVTSSSAANGGSVGCLTLGGTYLDPAVSHLGVGSVTAPVEDGNYYLVVRLASRSEVSLGAVRSTVVTAMIDAGQQGADKELTAALRSSSVGIDPRYGNASPAHLTLVLAATSPPASAELSTSANRPTLTPASA